MKTNDELNALKEEVETLNKKLAELSDEEMAQVTGGINNEAKERFKRDKKPHVNIGTIGSVDHSKTTLTAAITNHIAQNDQKAQNDFLENIDPLSKEQDSERGITLN